MNKETAKEIADQWLQNRAKDTGHDLVTCDCAENEYDYIFAVSTRSGEPLFGAPLPVAVSKQTGQAREVYHEYFNKPITPGIRIKRLFARIFRR